MAYVDLDREAAKLGHLPDVCIHCGAQAPARQTMTFFGTTPVTMTAGVGLLQTQVPICDRHRLSRVWRWLAEFAAWALWIGLMVVVINTKEDGFAASLLPYKGAISAACLVAFLLVLLVRVVMFYATVRMTGASWEVIQITNVSDQFALAYYGHGPEAEEVADVMLEEAD